ncbi:uncharacterized protein LOC131167089 isoform X2 [Malania oleifera]|uniref:uncharacterized protein LOC131167089 isoform X2 n=1 Tax=Malania oleifera TaxID=397392 RepID=UPI0025AE840E|nr:uncharacterized protein LOC131167089 isoform X2 [Malania oleifera]
MTSSRFFFTNGIVLTTSDAPSVSSFLQSHPGAYTTTRTHNDASCLLFWERHLRRLADSARILCSSSPELFFKCGKSEISLPIQSSIWESVIQSLVNDSLSKVLPVASSERRSGEELAITALVSGNLEKLKGNEEVNGDRISQALDVCVHVGAYVPPVFGKREHGAHLAVVGRGRDVAAAKYSDWVRIRKPLEKLKPPLATELLLSNDGDQILEGCVTNFFAVCRIDNNEAEERFLNDNTNSYSFEVQTAPLRDGVLPGVIRQLVIEVCLTKGIPLREVAPSWSKHEAWEEAFVTSSLRLMQHVETIQVPSSWESLESKTWRQVSWEEKQFEEEIMEKVGSEGLLVSSLV